jgi:hypothetical protein
MGDVEEDAEHPGQQHRREQPPDGEDAECGGDRIAEQSALPRGVDLPRHLFTMTLDTGTVEKVEPPTLNFLDCLPVVVTPVNHDTESAAPPGRPVSGTTLA